MRSKYSKIIFTLLIMILVIEPILQVAFNIGISYAMEVTNLEIVYVPINDNISNHVGGNDTYEIKSYSIKYETTFKDVKVKASKTELDRVFADDKNITGWIYISQNKKEARQFKLSGVSKEYKLGGWHVSGTVSCTVAWSSYYDAFNPATKEVRNAYVEMPTLSFSIDKFQGKHIGTTYNVTRKTYVNTGVSPSYEIIKKARRRSCKTKPTECATSRTKRSTKL